MECWAGEEALRLVRGAEFAWHRMKEPGANAHITVPNVLNTVCLMETKTLVARSSESGEV